MFDEADQKPMSALVDTLFILTVAARFKATWVDRYGQTPCETADSQAASLLAKNKAAHVFCKSLVKGYGDSAGGNAEFLRLGAITTQAIQVFVDEIVDKLAPEHPCSTKGHRDLMDRLSHSPAVLLDEVGMRDLVGQVRRELEEHAAETKSKKKLN